MTHQRFIFAFLCITALSSIPATAGEDLLRAVKESPIRGGVCVVVGEVDAAMLETIAASGPYLIHALSTQAGTVDAIRSELQGKRLYGRITVDPLVGDELPYADNLVSLVVVSSKTRVAEAEVLRALRPFGQAILTDSAAVRTVTKPMSSGMDQWSHWRRAADRNPVSTDSLVEVPERVQWLASVNAISERSHFVVCNGRAFAQDREWLIARDAGSGLPLWKTRIKTGKDVDWDYSVKVAALIASHGERVYALMEDNQLKALDAATGQPAIVYADAGSPYDFVITEAGGHTTIVALCPDSVRALDAVSGKLLWKVEAERPHNLVVGEETAFFVEGNDRRGATEGVLHARGLRTGAALWNKTYAWARRSDAAAYGFGHLVFEIRRPTDWRELYAQQPEQKKKDNYRLVVVSARTGEEVQKLEQVGSSARHGEFHRGFWFKEQLLIEKNTTEGLSLALFRLDDFAKPDSVFKANYLGDRGWGHCYPPVLTDRFYINGQLNFTDLASKKQESNQITRGACNTAREGYIPAYGMLYTFPKHCVCFPMLDGNVCLAPSYSQTPRPAVDFIKGSAWPAKLAAEEPGQWPTFRGDAWRSGGTEQTVPAEIEVLWEQAIPGPDYSHPIALEWPDSPFAAGEISAPVIGHGVVLVAQTDVHRVVALDRDTGRMRWQFTAGGRIDGPPTLHRGLCLFGSRDGWLYALRADDGALIWKRRVAPHERRISVYGQLESPWPVAATVLIVDGLGYASAGIHPNADGGIRVVCFRPETGEVVWTGVFDNLGMGEPWPAPWQPSADRNPWRNIWPKEYRYVDLPVRDGDSVAVSRCLFDLKTGKRELRKTSGFYQITPTGAYLPRTAWRYGSVRNLSPLAVSRAGAVFSSVPGIKKLFRADFTGDGPFATEWVQVPKERLDSGLATMTSRLLEQGARWTEESQESKTALNRAMLVAGNRLFVVTPKGELQIRDADTGKMLRELKLPIAADEGLAAAGGRLFLSTVDGRVLCLGIPAK